MTATVPRRTTPPVGAISVLRDRMNALRGRLFETIEAAGLPDRQTTAIKGLIRKASYDVQADVEAAIRREGDAP